MSNFPKYTAEENITRVQMEKDVKFVVVEGLDDLPIYESTIRSMLPEQDLDMWDIVHVGGKTNIKQLIEDCSHGNFICIADKDFDERIENESVINLSRYSIENFLICEEAISAALSIALRVKFQDVLSNFNLNKFHQEVEHNASHLIKALFYYHRVVAKGGNSPNISWSDTNILAHPPKWGICNNQVQQIISKLIPENVTNEEIAKYFEDNFEKSEKLAYDFPGKMIKVLLQRHVHEYFKAHKKRGSPFSTLDSFTVCISAVLNKSNNFTRQIEPVLTFLMQKAA